MKAYPGKLVFSKAGRDRDKYFIIIEYLNDSYVLIADGDLRKIQNPKKKKVKHLTITPIESKEIIDKINAGRKILNSDLRKTIAELKLYNNL